MQHRVGGSGVALATALACTLYVAITPVVSHADFCVEPVEGTKECLSETTDPWINSLQPYRDIVQHQVNSQDEELSRAGDKVEASGGEQTQNCVSAVSQAAFDASEGATTANADASSCTTSRHNTVYRAYGPFQSGITYSNGHYNHKTSNEMYWASCHDGAPTICSGNIYLTDKNNSFINGSDQSGNSTGKQFSITAYYNRLPAQAYCSDTTSYYYGGPSLGSNDGKGQCNYNYG